MTTERLKIGRDLWMMPMANGRVSAYRGDSRRQPPVTRLPTGPAEALGFRVALKCPVTVQAQHPTNTFRPGIDGAETVPTCGMRRVLVARQAFAPSTIGREHTTLQHLFLESLHAGSI